MIALGLSPLDKDATASLVEDGRILFAAGEERFSRTKQHAGFPGAAIQAALDFARLSPDDIDVVTYAFLDADAEAQLMRAGLGARPRRSQPPLDLDAARARVPADRPAVHGLARPDERRVKGALKESLYRLLGDTPPFSGWATAWQESRWLRRSVADHRRWQAELLAGLSRLGLSGKLRRSEHHLSHAAGAYLASGFDRALVVTIDGYGSGLAGSVGVGEGGKLRRLHGIRFPHSLGTFYECVTASLGFHPDRHAGKIVGLAAFGDPAVASELLLQRCERRDGDLLLADNLNVYLARLLAAELPMIDVAAAYQHVLEVLACGLVAHWVAQTGCESLVLSGGVTANVKMNQRLHAVPGVRRTFIDPNMGDGGCGTGLGLLQTWRGGPPTVLEHVYLGPGYGEAEIEAELRREGLAFGRPADLAAEVARRIHAGQVVGRFDGRMEYGPRALGNRSILYHAREPQVNQWLNKRLGRTEFMPFAPVTTWEARERCYLGLSGAEHAAEFMTLTFDCTRWMAENCPAAVHVDNTARPQLIRREVNPGYYAILEAYERLSGIPCLINTSFNMHEEPIVCSPRDALRAFLDGRLDGLAIGPFYVEAPQPQPTPVR